MHALGFGGHALIARTLARHAWKLSPRSVGRFLKERRPTPTTPPPPSARGNGKRVEARYPNHLWMVDLTRLPTLFPFLKLTLAVVFDAFSRMPLAARSFLTEPSAHAVADLFQHAVQTHGKPRHLVTDQGVQFTAEAFRNTVTALGIRHRFGALHRHGSIALLERLFRTLKDALSLRSWRPWTRQDLDRRLDNTLRHYAFHRPHSRLHDRVPAEVYYGIRNHLPPVLPAPRGRPGEPGPDPPDDIAILDPENKRLPILLPNVA